MKTQTSCRGTTDYSNSLTRKKCFDIIKDNTGLACQKVKFLASNAKNNTTSSSISIIILSPPTLVYQWLLYKRKPSGWNRSLDEFSPRFIGLGDDLESIVLSIARKPLFRVDTEDYRMEQVALNIK
jgi:hypothetical protein